MINKLRKFIPVSENSKLNVSAYGNTITVLSMNRKGIPLFSKLSDILEESVSLECFPIILNSIVEHLDTSYTINEFVVKKLSVTQKTRKNPVKSRISKMAWKKNKSAMTKGLRKFHSSSKGKSFHKALGKLIAKSSSKNETALSVEELLLELNELRISISSAITQLFINMKNSPNEYVDFSSKDFEELMNVYSEVMKDIQDAWLSSDAEIIEDTIDEVVAEVAGVLIGVEVDYLYIGDGLSV